ncbi:MAG: VOC family protein [Actinobacteria bacterium]|nr:VOC family protein [Actinomycetota bacterium]
MGATLAPFLMFEGQAGEALELYAGAFEDAEVGDVRRYGDEGPGAAGTIEHAVLRVGEREVRLIDSPVEHAFGFTPAISLFVDLDSAEEVDAAFEKLSAGGQVLMPLDAYPFSPRFAWIADRFGVSWQLSATPGATA